MKRPKSESPIAPFFPEEANGVTAIEGLRYGNERPVGHYARVLGEILGKIASQFDPDGKGEARWQFQRTPSKQRGRKTNHANPMEVAEEWEGTFDQISDAVEHGDAKSIGSYLREAADVLRLVGDALDPQHQGKHWQLEFFIKGHATRKWTNSKILALVAKETRKAEGQQESAIVQVSKDIGLSRATIFRALRQARSASKSQQKT